MLDLCRHIIFNPLAWINPARLTLPERFNSPRCRSLINGQLLRQYQLPVGDLNLDHEQERFLAQNWAILSRAAFMVACQRHRLQLARTGLFARLDKATRQFALAELTPASDDPAQLNLAGLWQYACDELNTYALDCSDTIKKRIILLCPDTVTASVSSKTADNGFLLRLAVQNAKRSA